MQIVGVAQYLDPLLDKPFAVTLAARAPHRRTFALIEHAELDGTAVRDDTHLTSQSIYLAHDLAFGNAAYGRVATHLRDLIYVHRDQHGLTAHTGRCAGCFTTGVTCSYYYDIVFKIHLIWSFLFSYVPISKQHCDYRW